MVIKKFDDYMEQLQSEFPDVDMKSLKKIVKHGLDLVSRLRRLGDDIFLNNNREAWYFYLGDKTPELKDRLERSRLRTNLKYRHLHRLQRLPYSGYYYFNLTPEQYEMHLKQEPVDKVLLCKLEKEAVLFRKGKHLFKVLMDESPYWIIKEENYNTNNTIYIKEL